MRRKILTSILLSIMTLCCANAQDTIMLMRGKRLLVSDSKVEITTKGDTVVSYQIDGKRKHKSIYKVFSVSGKDGEQIFYSPTTLDVELTVEQMRRFLQGKADYTNKFNWGFFAGGVAATTAGVFIPTLNFKVGSNNANIPVGMLVPFGYVFAIGNTTKSAEKLKAQFPNMPDDEYYLMGVQAAVSQQRMRDGALGVLTGGIIWVTAFCISD